MSEVSTLGIARPLGSGVVRVVEWGSRVGIGGHGHLGFAGGGREGWVGSFAMVGGERVACGGR